MLSALYYTLVKLKRSEGSKCEQITTLSNLSVKLHSPKIATEAKSSWAESMGGGVNPAVALQPLEFN
jgi:hypothetical protein